MEPEDWGAVSEIYLEGIATEHATFQTTCPPYTAWDAFHIKECRLVILDGGELVRKMALEHGIKDTRLHIGLWATDRYIKKRKMVQGKTYTIYLPHHKQEQE